MESNGIIYKITFTPSGAYFFGNEKRFEYPGSKRAKTNQYYIEGEKMPSQSTILGALRYILLPEKGFSNLHKKENVKAIGESGFNMESTEEQSFGIIKRVSAIFINKGNELFIPTPYDHNKKEPYKEGDKIYYTPMCKYKKLNSSTNQSLYLDDYDVKYGIEDSFMSIDTGHIVDDLFTTDVRVGIGIKSTKDAFFKKAYKCLNKEYSFCVFAQIDDKKALDGRTSIVTLGQGKVPFSVKFKEYNETIEKVYDSVNRAITKAPLVLTERIDDEKFNNEQKQEFLKHIPEVNETRIYCLSDMLIDGNPYQDMKMAIVQIKDYRSFFTTYNKDNDKRYYYTRGDFLHRLIKAGSIFIPDAHVKTDSFSQNNNKQKNAAKIGFNQTITIKTEEIKND